MIKSMNDDGSRAIGPLGFYFGGIAAAYVRGALAADGAAVAAHHDLFATELAGLAREQLEASPWSWGHDACHHGK